MNNIEFTDVVLGISYGDEGKGVCVYDLLKKHSHNLCVKFNGGPNAGNTIYIESPPENNNNTNNPTNTNNLPNNNNTPTYRKMVLHMLPIGMAKPDVFNLISSDCVLDIAKLKKELEKVKELGAAMGGMQLNGIAQFLIENPIQNK